MTTVQIVIVGFTSFAGGLFFGSIFPFGALKKRKRIQCPHGKLEAVFEYGTLNDIKARRNIYTGDVEFVLWKAGEQGHEKDFYHIADKNWFSSFKPTIV